VSLLEKIRGGQVPVSVAPALSDADGFEGAPAAVSAAVPDTVPQDWSGVEQDPAPGAAPPRPRGAVFKPATAGAITPALRKRIAGEIEAYIEMAAIPIVMRDEVCGGAIHAQAKPMADAIANILSRYPDLAHKFLATGVLGDWLKLVLAIKPIAEAIYQHHIVKPVDEEAVPDVSYDEFQPYRPGS
jgi:hypothetical protein